MKYLFFPIFLFSSFTVFSQTREVPFSSVNTALKTNLLYDLTSTVNLGIEFKTGAQYTLDVSVNYNPWTFTRNRKFKHLLVQPEFRYWLCEAFNGHFFGGHAHYARYNVGGIKLPLLPGQNLETIRYQGDLYGVGVSYGYQWYLSPKWNLEATLGLGYAYSDYRAHECHICGEELYHKNKHYLGATKAAISLVYFIQ